MLLVSQGCTKGTVDGCKTASARVSRGLCDCILSEVNGGINGE